MSEPDPIVEEVRRIRDAHAAKFNYDPDAIFRDIKEQERRSGRTYVSFADDPIETIGGATLTQKMPSTEGRKPPSRIEPSPTVHR